MPKTILRIHNPAVYLISVQGVLDETWSSRLGGLTIMCEPTGADRGAVTTLRGSLLDQAALLGVLNTLYDLHLPLLSVEYLAIG